MQFRVLGSLEVWRGGDLVDIGSTNERKILAALLVHANSVVPISRLIEVVWGEEPPDSDRNALQTYVARLRRRLRSADSEAPIVTRPPGYAIELDASELDSLRFRELVELARATSDADPARVLDVLDDALDLWRGPAFAEFADDDVARAEAAGLDELRQTAVEERVDALLALCRDADAVSVLEGVVAAHPLRERPHAQLMTALARCGRQVEALELYKTFRARLADDLGLVPSAGLRDLQSQILTQGPHVASPERPHAQPSPDGNLPAAVTVFVGREDDLSGLVGLLARGRILTLIGVGGVGKTRLAVRLAEEVAPDFADGTWIVELARLSSPEAVPHAVALALGVALPSGGDPWEALVDAVRARQMLLVVDNCEHVLPAAARLVDSLARQCPRITLVATSRERLGVTGEHVWPVLPLPVPPPTAPGEDVGTSPSVVLFVDRAGAARADFELNDSNRDSIVQICRGLDGLPLSLEIAAARLGAMTPRDLAQRLRDRFALLTTGPRSEGGRHRTLLAVLDWSYGLLDDDERAVFDRLSIFAGGWTLEAATSVCADGSVSAHRVAGLVASLADKSMVVPPSPSGPARYGMLETLRLYGAEHLDARRDTERTADAHADYLLAIAEQAEIGIRGPDEREWVIRLRDEVANLRSAHSWARTRQDPEVALRLSVALHRFAVWQANDEILSWAEAAAELPSAQSHPLLPVVRGSAAIRRTHRGEMDVATRYAEQALAACDGPDDLRRALPTEAVASICLLSGRLDEAFVHCGEAVRLWRLAGNNQAEVWSQCSRAVAAGLSGDLVTALALTAEARTVTGSAHNHTMMAMILYAEGEALLEVDPIRALEPIDAALAHAEAVDNVLMKGLALVSRTSLRGRHGDPAVALRMFDDVIQYWRRGGGWSTQWITLRNLVELLSRLGAHEQAAVLYGACVASTTSPPSFGPEAARLDAVVDSLVSGLGERAFSAARARGASLSDDEAVSFASDVTRRLIADSEQRQP